MSEHDDHIDEDALNLFLLQGLDLPTALAASIRDNPKPPPSEPPKRSVFALGWYMLAAIFVVVLALRIIAGR